MSVEEIRPPHIGKEKTKSLTKINIKNLQGSEFITNFAVLKVKQ